MARIRTIKPEFFTDVKVGECSASARLLFVGTWIIADDYGNLERSAKQIRAQLFPYDDIDCEPLVQELIDHELIEEYEVDGVKFLHINGFEKHQKIDKPSKPRVPGPKKAASTRRIFGEDSASTRGGLALEGKGREGRGVVEESKGGGAAPQTPEGLHQLQYGKVLLDDLGLPEAGNLESVASAIASFAKQQNITKAQAFEHIRSRALADRDAGTPLTKFWFQDARYGANANAKRTHASGNYESCEEAKRILRGMDSGAVIDAG